MVETPLQRHDDRGTGCLDADLLASYVDGRATPAERTTVEAHLAQCEDCFFIFSETLREQAQGDGATKKSEPARWVPKVAAGLAAAAALLIAVAVGTSYYSRPSSTLVVALSELDAASGPYRRFEPRVTALPTYRPIQPAVRSGASAGEASLAVREASLKVEAVAQSAASGIERQRALAAAYLAQGEAQQAAAALTPLASSANDAGAANDIAAAYLSRGAEGDAKLALDLLERAVTLDPNRAEAWFNLGLAAESAGQPPRAIAAWTRFLALDSSSEWANEARRHLEKLKDGQIGR